MLLGNFLSAQSVISGRVLDSLSQPVDGVNVYLKEKENNAIFAYAYSDSNGEYTLKTNKQGEFLLSFSSLGYETKEMMIQLGTENQAIQDIFLAPASTQLDKVVIISERAITEKKDTIVFNASSFKQGEETVVQDLLKKLPGVDVSETGTIKVDGKEVEKVMVEGDDFFKKGYKMLTKNLNVEAVSKVEVLRRYSNNKLLKGIEESNKVAINLKLDEDFKRDWFGNVEPGYGVVTENRYDIDATLSSFGRRNKYFFIGSLNNIGEDVTEDVRGLIYAQNYTNEPGSIGGDQTATAFIDLPFAVPGLKKSRANFNNAGLASLNSIFKLSDKVNLKVLGLFNTDDASFFRKGFNTFIAPSGDSFTNTEDYTLQKDTKIGFGRIELEYDISDTQSLVYEGKFNDVGLTTNTDLLFNNQANKEILQDNNQVHDHLIRYSHRFKDRKVLLISGRFSSENRPENYSNTRFLFQELFPDSEEITGISQFSNNKFDYFGLKSHLLDRKKNEDLLDVSLGYEYRKDKLSTDFLLITDQTPTSISTYQNRADYAVHDIFLTAGYRKKINKIALAINAEGHQLINRLTQEDVKEDQTPFLINTTFNFDWEINTENKIFAFAERTTTNASISDIYSNYILTGFRSFNRGTGTFNQLNSNRLYAGYNLGNFGSRFIANISLSYVKDNDFLSDNLQIEPNFTQSTKIQINDREFFAANAKIERYLKWMRNNFKIKSSYSKSEYKNIVNNTGLRTVDFEEYTIGFELRSGFKGFFNYHFGTTWEFDEIETPGATTNVQQNTSFLDLFFTISSRLTLELQNERFFFSNLPDNDDSFYFADMELRYKPKNKQFNISLIGSNLLNTNRYRDYDVTDTFISSTSYRLLPRYLLVKVGYKF